MRRFRFRLEHLLLLRRYAEREWELKLAKAVGICVKIQKRIEVIDKEITRSIASRFLSDIKQDYSLLVSYELYMHRLTNERKEQERALLKAEKEREDIQKEYLEVSKKRKVLEKLKERREREYYTLMRKEEFKETDDINNGAYTRKKCI